MRSDGIGEAEGRLSIQSLVRACGHVTTRLRRAQRRRAILRVSELAGFTEPKLAEASEGWWT